LRITCDEKKPILLTQVCPIVSKYVHSLEDVERWDVIKVKIRLDIKKLEAEPIPAPPIFYPPEPEEEEEEPEPEPEEEEEPEIPPPPKPIPDEPIIDIPTDRTRQPPPRAEFPWFVIIILIGFILCVASYYWPLFQQPKRATYPTVDYEQIKQNTPFKPLPTSVIPTSTENPTPIPDPVQLPFVDYFNEKYRNDWIVSGSEPYILDGVIYSDNETWMFAGDKSWKNYNVEVELEISNSPLIIAIRAQDSNNFIALEHLKNDYYALHLIQNGHWELLSKDYYSIHYPGTVHIVDVEVVRNRISYFVDGERIDYFPVPENVRDDFSTGFAGIKISNSLKVYSVRIHPRE